MRSFPSILLFTAFGTWSLSGCGDGADPGYPTTGGNAATGQGGATATGGTTGQGGTTATGGTTGGSTAKGGSGGSALGGAPATGGVFASGGVPTAGSVSVAGAATGGSSGGTASAGAAGSALGGSGGMTSGGTMSGGTTSGGSVATGGANGGSNTNGGKAAGGSSTAGGSPSTGGKASGGAATGGAATGGAATGGAATGGSAGSGGSSSCGVQPVNPNSIPAVRNVLCYLYQIKGQSTLSGVQDCSWSPMSDVTYVNQTTGVYPAIVGGDFLYTDAVGSATASWRAGGLSMIRYHMGRPEDSDSYASSLGTTDLAATLTPGTSRYTGLMNKFNHAATELLRLQAAGVVVLWAPFHEAQPNGWFWWSKGSGEQFKQLWNLMFTNFAQRGVNNVIWLMPYSGSPAASFYPGKAQVDIAGSDTYADSQPFAANYRNTVSAIGSNALPITLHETGYVPNPTDMFDNAQAPFVLFNVWCNDWLQATSKNSVAELQTAFGHARTLNRGELPRF